ncbi:MAG TPA: extracellular solute-binding protein [Luteibaculaceae bacterium]|nr:extracellular solute-binding protein [Luteibaculaceae bacterium]
MKNFGKIFTLAVASALAACSGSANKNTEKGEVNVYTQRHYDIDKKVFEDFTRETGIVVNVVTAGADELLAKLETEAELSPCDLFIAVDAGGLTRAKAKGLLQAYTSAVIEKNVMPAYRDTEHLWTGLTMRSRVIAVSTDLKVAEPKNYEDLASPIYKGMILSRSSSSSYNQALLASIIHAGGSETAQNWAKGVVANFARDPQGNDRDQIKDIAAGKGKIALINTYYLGKMQISDDPIEKSALDKVRIIAPNQDNRGAHINVSGAGIAKYAKNKSQAQALLDYLVKPEVQRQFAGANQEYTVDGSFTSEGVLGKLGKFKVDTMPLQILGEKNPEAIQIFDRVGWK